MANIYIEAASSTDAGQIKVTLESLIVLHVFKACDNINVILNVVVSSTRSITEPLFEVDCTNVPYNLIKWEAAPPIAKFSVWPVMVVGNTVVAGLASVSRQIIKHGNSADVTTLLGFREACLIACNETSLWTKFCEIEVPSMVKFFIHNPKDYFRDDAIYLPSMLSRFESHMSEPIRVHNVYKLARITNNDKLIKSNVPIEELNLEHRYAEGPSMTLSDLILFPCFKVMFQGFERSVLKAEIPLTVKWFENLCDDAKQPKINFNVNVDFQPINGRPVNQTNVPKESLYSPYPKRHKPRSRIFTRQNDIENALELLGELPESPIFNPDDVYTHDVDFSWSSIPPISDAVPASRANRKSQQLENLAKAALKVSKNKSHVIVDFCSGSGHLGILVATLLPNCHIILVENKERSLERARERITDLNLTNVSLVQSNLDYFSGEFDVGLALHACGVATDLVIKKCIENKANFICCPCCYGGIQNCHYVGYPRSGVFKETTLSYRDYLIIGHSADQTHDAENAKTAQGFQCMNVIDTDRKLQAEEAGYTVFLNKLIPPSCTPKNNLLIGLYEKC